MYKELMNKIKSTFIEYVGDTSIGGIVITDKWNNKIIMYHGVTKSSHTLYNRRHVSESLFARQIKFLTRYTNVLSVQDFFEQKFDSKKPNYAITFDDGYLNNYTVAKPILEYYNCPATFYITGLNQINQNILWPDFLNIISMSQSEDMIIEDELFQNKNGVYFSLQSGKSIYEIIKNERADYAYKQAVMSAFKEKCDMGIFLKHPELWELMSDDNIQELGKSKLIKIGGHGYYHNNLGVINPIDAENELRKSQSYLENLSDYSITELAYPDGSYSANTIRAADSIGYKYQLATENFLFDDEVNDKLIKTRTGIYNLSTCLSQL